MRDLATLDARIAACEAELAAARTARVKAIVADYEDGATLRALAARDGIAMETMRATLMAAGCKMRSRGPHKDVRRLLAIRRENIATARWAGDSYADIARSFGVSHQTIHRACKAAGLVRGRQPIREAA